MFQPFFPFSVDNKLFFSFVILSATLFVPWKAIAAALPDQQNIVQFSTTNGQVLGFQPGGLYVAGSDHLLHVVFISASAVRPKVEGSWKNKNMHIRAAQVEYHNPWPGINLHYVVAENGIMESTWKINPGADVHQIALRYNAPVVIGINGDLNIKYPTGIMHESTPIAWQEIGGHRHPVKVAFRRLPSPVTAPVIGFKVRSYDTSKPLIIDPTLSWNTFMGESRIYDTGKAIALDRQGNVYVVGYSGPWGNTSSYTGGLDAFVAKYDSNGNLLWNTFLGSSQFDSANAIAVDGNGNIFIAGESLAAWGNPKRAYAGDRDGFAAKLDSNGHVVWNTFLGSTGTDFGRGVAVDSSGTIYVTGDSDGQWGSPKQAYAGDFDAFAAKLDTDGHLQWNTFMGSSKFDNGMGIAVDGNDNTYITGYSRSAWGNNPVRPYIDGGDAFVAKLNSNGVRIWHTFLGSTATDVGLAVAIDNHSIYVAGTSGAAWGNPKTPYAGNEDAFAAKLNTDGHLQWNTFMGSAGDDEGQSIAVDGNGNVYVTGISDAAWGIGRQTYKGGRDIFAAKLGNVGNLQWNIFAGSSVDDEGLGIVVQRSGKNIYLTGNSDATWGTPKNPHTGGGDPDAFAAKLQANCHFYIFKSKNGTTTAVCL